MLLIGSKKLRQKRALDYGTLRHLCSCPFHCFIIVFVAMLLFGGFIFVPLAKITHSISLLLYWYLPYKLAKFYTEYEPHGKKMHVFIGDYLIYFWDFKINKKLSTMKIG